MTTSRNTTGSRRLLARAGRFLVAYLVASAVATFVFSEVRGGGHPHAPFTMFPEYFLIAPFMPVILVVGSFETRSTLALVGIGTFVACFVGSWLAYGVLRPRSPPQQP